MVEEDLANLVKDDRLTEVTGIGPSLAAQIKEIYTTGESRLLKKLQKDALPGTLELSLVPGLTLRRIKALSSSLGVSTVDELAQACREHKVARIKGFGDRTENLILSNVETFYKSQKQLLLLHAMAAAHQLIRYLQNLPSVAAIDVAGPLRRWHEIVEDITIVVGSEQADAIFASVASLPVVARAVEETADYIKVALISGPVVKVIATSNFPVRILLETGSTDHICRLQAIARAKNYRLAEDGLWRDGQLVPIQSERNIYELLGLHFIPPELREGQGEFEQARNQGFEDLVDIAHIQGMIHCHTVYSDGTKSVEEMVRAAQDLGMRYITITDHSPSAFYAGGLSIENLRQQWHEIDTLQEKVQIRILKGTESDILADGRLDYPDFILDQMDLVIASVHSRFKLGNEAMTQRVVDCLKQDRFKVWGHPLGRLLLRRSPIDCDVEGILEQIAGSNTAVEINGDPHRLDLPVEWVKEARKHGLKFVISTDAHALSDYNNLAFGVHQARRAGVRNQEVLNTYNLSDFVLATSRH